MSAIPMDWREQKALGLLKQILTKYDTGKAACIDGHMRTAENIAYDAVEEYRKLDEKQENTKGFKWLTEHSWEYGFILRYPNGETDITGIIYEPWHFRYVGLEAAKEITESGLTLEEYVGARPVSEGLAVLEEQEQTARRQQGENLYTKDSTESTSDR